MTILSLKHAAAMSCVALCTSAPPAWSQVPDQGTLLKGKDVTENNVLDALTPPAAASGDVDTGALRTRGIVPTLRRSTADEVIKPRKKASAMLLITFDTNSVALTPQSKAQLDVVAAALKNDRLKDFRFDVEGHADPRGTADVNQTLSQRRAEVVRAYLIETQGISDARLRAVGMGDADPLNTRDLAAPENRRVAITTVAP